MGKELRIDEEFKNLIPSLTKAEYEQLKSSILADGCRDAIVVWKEEGILLDGHNRHAICSEHNRKFKKIEMSFGGRSEAQNWVILNHMGRRNLTEDQRFYLIGKLHREAKGAVGGDGSNQYTNSNGVKVSPLLSDIDQPEQTVIDKKGRTREKLAVAAKVSPKTVERAQIYANALDDVASKVNDPTIKDKIISGVIATNRKDVIELSNMPKEKVQEVIEIVERDGKKIGTALNEIKMEHIHDDIESGKTVFPKGKYKTIVFDPPWPMKKTEMDAKSNGTEVDYPIMSIEEIKKFPLQNMAHDNCHLYLWTTLRHLPMAFKLAEHWGFKYECLMTCVKNLGITPSSRWMHSTDHVLFCTKGRLPLLKSGQRLDFAAETSVHGLRPDVFYDLVQDVSPGPKIDVFARKRREGWDVFGNEVEGKENELIGVDERIEETSQIENTPDVEVVT